MNASEQASQTSSPTNPTAMLSAMTKSMAELVEIQKIQKEQIEGLQQQNERLIDIMSEPKGDSGLTNVKVENINMPFLAMVGFLVKLSLASIPAMIIIGLLYLLVVLVSGGVLAGLFAAFS